MNLHVSPTATDATSFLQSHPDTHIFLDRAAAAAPALTGLGRVTAESISQETR